MDQRMNGWKATWKDGLTDGLTDGPKLLQRSIVMSNKPDRHKSRARNSLSHLITPVTQLSLLIYLEIALLPEQLNGN